MISYYEWKDTLPYFNMQPKGPIPTVSDEDGIYPYESFIETASRPVLKKLQMVTIENDYLSVTVCPDLGGRIESIIDKESGKEVLFRSGGVKPVRILPRMAFISGGIEVSFPISHTPSQIEKVYYDVKKLQDRVYVWCGEKEIRCGMQWTIEFSLGEGEKFLSQRTRFYNPTGRSHEWMSWSNAAVPAVSDTELYFPAGSVKRHGDKLETIQWEKDKSYKASDFDRMEGFFWSTADRNAFGAFTPSLGTGLYHIADREDTCGIKLWLYGEGKHEAWSHQTAYRKAQYIEIQAGPIQEQADKSILKPLEEHCHKEFWIPSTEALSIYDIELPDPDLIAEDQIPLFDFMDRENTGCWLDLLDAWSKDSTHSIPEPPETEAGIWPPSGMEHLGDGLQWAAENSEGVQKDLWNYYLAVYYAGFGDIDRCIRILTEVDTDWGNAFLGRLLRVNRKDYEAAKKAFDRITGTGWQLHPQVIVERDITLSHLGREYVAERVKWLEQASSLEDDELRERRAYLLYDMGEYHKAYELLKSTDFQKIHQRYKRTELWNMLNAALDKNEPVPDNLGEDDLAVYGAYRVYDEGKQ